MSTGVSSSITVLASTMSGNRAEQTGGAAAASGWISDSTITANSSPGVGGVFAAGVTTLTNSIVANQSQGTDCGAQIVSGGYNLDSDGSCVGGAVLGDLTAADAQLRPLTDNGGPTRTHAPRRTSAAVDSGATCAAYDQRGFPRPADRDADGNATCDRGAVELKAPSPPGPPRSVHAALVDENDSWTRLTWQAPSSDGGLPILRYRIQGQTIEQGESTASWVERPSTTHLSADDLCSGSRSWCTFRVAAVTAAGSGPWAVSNTIQAPIVCKQDCPPPGPGR
jgi:hypothetical protein